MAENLEYRDLGLGDQGDDVARAQRFLIALGYEISDEERRKKLYGQSMAAATDKLRQDLSDNPLLWLRAIIQVILGGDSQSLEALLQVSTEDLEADLLDPQGKPSGGRYAVGGADDGLGVGQAERISRTEQKDTSGLKALADGLDGKDAAARAGQLATRFIGQCETGRNAGAIVQMVNGYTGDPWCGGFAHYIFNRTMPGVYDQAGYRSARSYVEEGKQYGAFHGPKSGYIPQVGDAIVFSRTGDPSKGHVGIVVGYDEKTRQVRYVAGNDGDAVRARTIDLDNPPSRLLGFSDSHEIARRKGIDIGKAAPQSRIDDAPISPEQQQKPAAGRVEPKPEAPKAAKAAAPAQVQKPHAATVPSPQVKPKAEKSHPFAHLNVQLPKLDLPQPADVMRDAESFLHDVGKKLGFAKVDKVSSPHVRKG